MSCDICAQFSTISDYRVGINTFARLHVRCLPNTTAHHTSSNPPPWQYWTALGEVVACLAGLPPCQWGCPCLPPPLQAKGGQGWDGSEVSQSVCVWDVSARQWKELYTEADSPWGTSSPMTILRGCVPSNRGSQAGSCEEYSYPLIALPAAPPGTPTALSITGLPTKRTVREAVRWEGAAQASALWISVWLTVVAAAPEEDAGAPVEVEPAMADTGATPSPDRISSAGPSDSSPAGVRAYWMM